MFARHSFEFMPKRNKVAQQNNNDIECASGAQCSRRNCKFQHPETRDLEANIHQMVVERRKKFIELRQCQEELINRWRPRYDACALLSCPYRHSPQWNLVENRRLAEEKRRQEKERWEQQRQNALRVTGDQPIDVCSGAKTPITDEYAYDNEYLKVYEKVWQKQTDKLIHKW